MQQVWQIGLNKVLIKALHARNTLHLKRLQLQNGDIAFILKMAFLSKVCCGFSTMHVLRLLILTPSSCVQSKHWCSVGGQWNTSDFPSAAVWVNLLVR